MIAGLLGVTKRTVRNWTRHEDAPRPGRPAHGVAERERVARAVAEESGRQGRSAGWRPVAAARPDCPVRLVQEELARHKRERRREERCVAAKRRLSIRVKGRDVLWSLDATHLGRLGGDAVEAQVVRDAATMEIPATTAGPPATAADAIAILIAAAVVRGGLPLVLVTDNGPQYTAALFRAFLAAYGVIHLRTVPHTPQHNAWVERANRELKEETGLGKGTTLPSVQHARALLEDARTRLNDRRLRRRLGYRTATGAGAARRDWYNVDLRARLVRAARTAVEDALQDTEGTRERRRKERAAILAVMEDFGLVQITRGGRHPRAVEPEGVS